MQNVQRGFTLLELLVTVAILGIVAAATLPNLGSFMASERSDAFITELTKTIKYAKAKANAVDEIVVICPVKDIDAGGACEVDWSENPIVAFVDTDNNTNFSPANDQMIRVIDKAAEDDIIQQAQGVGAIRIDGQGRLSQEHQFVFCPNGEGYTSTLQISVSGNTWKKGKNVLTCTTS